MFQSLPLFALIAIFLASAAVIWLAGTKLSDTTDVLSKRFHLGQALGGLLILAIVTNLPEIAITVAAAFTNQIPVAVGNILGGIAIQTVVLAVLDPFTQSSRPLTSLVKSLMPVLEASLVIVVLVLVVMSKQLSPSFALGGVGPGEASILLTWVVGLWLLNRARRGLPWRTQDPGQGAGQDGNDDQGDDSDDDQGGDKKTNTGRTLFIFAAAAIATLAAGIVIEQAGDGIAQQIGMTGALFGATFLAASTALPELSTGLEAVKIKDDTLAISDIFGGNAFLPVLFLVAGLLSGSPVLTQAQPADLYLTGLGILLTAVYIWGLVFRSERLFWRMGLDSLLVLILYILGIVGLIAVPGG
ncbi:MAG: sodium:calcium antiporter [Chloroflexia bacterium]